MSARAAACLLACVAAGCTCSPGRLGTRPLDGSVGGMDGAARRDGAPDPDGAAGRDGGAGSDASSDGGSERDASPDGSAPLIELRCDDGLDQDLDGMTDCADPDCEGAFCDAAHHYCTMGACGGCRGEPTETACGDGVDDDCDGMTDCADPECGGAVCSSGGGGVVCSGGVCPGCPEGDFESDCTDRVDGDCDGMTDCDDPDCMGQRCALDGSVCVPPGMCVCPGMELCQGVNDDCDMQVDEGCPRAIASCCPVVVTAGSAAGTPWVGECPSGAALIGVSGQEGIRVDQLQPICAVIRFVEDMTTRPEHTFYVRRGAPIPGTPQGASGSPTFTDQCPGDDFVIAVDGEADLGLDRIRLHCGSFTIARGAGFGWTLRRTATITLPARGGTGMAGMSFDSTCPANGVVSGLSGRATDTTVTQLSVTCRTLSLDLR